MDSQLRLEYLRADALGLSGLFGTALAGQLKLPGLELARQLEDIKPPRDRFSTGERARLARCLEARISTFEPPVAVLDSVRSIETAGASFVVCGQQPGAFGGPLLCLWKALQTVRIARALSVSWQQPVVPLYWNHADDHDVAEVHHGYFVNPNLDLQKITLAGLSSGRQPLSSIVFDDERQCLPAIRELLRQLFGYLPRIDEALELCMPQSGETFATASTRFLLQLFGHLGLVVLEPDWIREDLSHHLAALVGNDPRGALAAGEEALSKAGHEVPVPHAQAALLFRVDAAGRAALRLGGEGFAYDEEPGSRTVAELAAEVVQEPGSWSAGALLRPLVQDLALPVAAHVGGPRELACHAQLAGTRVHLGLPSPAFVPRVSVTLIDAENENSLLHARAPLAEVFEARGAFGDLSTTQGGSEGAEALRTLGAEVRQRLLDQRQARVAIDGTLSGSLKHTASKVSAAIEKLAGKVARAEANHLGHGRRHLRRINHSLVPRGLAQESVLNAMPFIAAYGTAWLDEVLEALDPFGVEHSAIYLGPLDGESGSGNLATP